MSIKDQRKFLHDLASPLTIAIGMLDSSLELLESKAEKDEEVITKLKKSAKAVERISEMLKARRSELHKMEAAEVQPAAEKPPVNSNSGGSQAA